MTDIGWSLNRSVLPPADVLDLDELKAHRRVTWTEEDDLIRALGEAAQEAIEKELSVSLMEQTWELRLDQFPCWELRLPRPTVGDTGPYVTLASDAVKYLDNNGVLQTLSASLYTVDSYSFPSRIYPVYGKNWPSTDAVEKAVTITYQAGKGNAEDVPSLVKTAIWLMVGDLYEHRERTITGTIVNDLPIYERLMVQHRCMWEPRYA